MNISTMNREELINELMWNGENNPSQLVYNDTWLSKDKTYIDINYKEKRDLKSMVVINGNPQEFTDEELQELVSFSREMTEHYDKTIRSRMQSSLVVIISKDDGYWSRKRISWENGLKWADTLKETLENFRKQIS